MVVELERNWSEVVVGKKKLIDEIARVNESE